jgi:hypothetical protein
LTKHQDHSVNSRHAIVTRAESESSIALTIIEAEARERFNSEAYTAQAAWHNENERLVRAFQDGQEDAAERYRAAVRTAQTRLSQRDVRSFRGIK